MKSNRWIRLAIRVKHSFEERCVWTNDCQVNCTLEQVARCRQLSVGGEGAHKGQKSQDFYLEIVIFN